MALDELAGWVELAAQEAEGASHTLREIVSSIRAYGTIHRAGVGDVTLLEVAMRHAAALRAELGALAVRGVDVSLLLELDPWVPAGVEGIVAAFLAGAHLDKCSGGRLTGCRGGS